MRGRVFMLFGLLILAVTVLLWAYFLSPRTASKHTSSKVQTLHAEYQIILTETHTGARLARLKDYISQHPNSPYIRAARVQYLALSAHETAAWAQLSNTRYDLRATKNDKASAKNAYLYYWGTFTRSEQIEALSPDTQAKNMDDNADEYAYKRSKSPFSKGSHADILAGAPPKYIATIPAIVKQVQAPRSTTRTTKVRPRKAATPIYPRRAKRRNIDGVVVLRLFIDDKGRVHKSVVVRAEAARYKNDFIRAARRAARRSRFHPKTINGKPVPSQGYQRVYTFQSAD